MVPAAMNYFTRLRPHRLRFEKGVPVLMYHKLGKSPSGVRLPSLYVSQKLFRQQLADLKSGGFTTASLEVCLTANNNSKRRIVLSFDDGFENVLRMGLEPLHAAGFRAIQYLVSGRLGATNDWETREGEAEERLMDAAQVREWLAAGHEIGAHTMTHPRLTRIPLAQAREEIIASRKSLEDAFGRAVTHFCYPYGVYNEAILDLVAEAGFTTATTTKPGLNIAGTPSFELRRLTARYASRKIADLWAIHFGRPVP